MTRWLPIILASLITLPLHAQDDVPEWRKPAAPAVPDARVMAAQKGGRTIYVDADAPEGGDGLTPDTAVPTIEAGVRLLREGDSLLLERGDVWTGEAFTWDREGEDDGFNRWGISDVTIGAYGDPSEPRPMIRHSSTVIELWHNDRPPSGVTIRDIYFYGHTRDPASPDFNLAHAIREVTAIRCRSTGENITIENCRFDFVSASVHVPDGRLQGLTVTDSVFYGSYATGSHAQGLYVNNVDGVTIEQNLFDRNGWNPDVEGAERTVFNHNIYCSNLNTGVVIRDNVITRGSMSGIQARSGGIIENNLFDRNNLHVHLSGSTDPTETHRIANNVMLDADDWRDGPATAINASDVTGLVIEGNLLSSGVGRPINLDSESGIAGLTIVDNVSAAPAAFLYVFNQGFSGVSVMGNTYAGDRIRDRDDVGVGFALIDNLENATVTMPNSLPAGWLEQARENWGSGEYTAAKVLGDVRSRVQITGGEVHDPIEPTPDPPPDDEPTEVERLRELLTEAEGRLAEREAELADLSEQVEAAERERERLRERIEESRAEVERRNEQIRQAIEGFRGVLEGLE